ncbi:unnamed protein product [Bursaphelenchus okinawaensis]|uniref:Mre11 DNA-binding domain-containing protein n=1 Tax=Bursaphelenchus okinawaensis TaxID=465554 RepID=A0A811KI67_9BILA|nr:unnamed protein product [Bursaphelenchus okinawaensis]CAG9103665.1 unnamed protein product [Bursaphelenchus okinawaensis]
MKICIASDVHCGYGENKKYVYEDSFEAFEEVLMKASSEKCDFVLLGGDLFHENQPSRDTQLRVMRLIRQHCLSGPETSLKVKSNGEETFATTCFKRANIEDENLTVSIPIFTIHGNHDDLSGKGQTAVDLFHEAGVLNLFGKFENVKYFEVNPVLLEKENEDGSVSKVALYGISSQRDDRLARAFQSGHVKFNKPDDYQDYFNVLVMHQNRPKRSNLRTTGSYIPTDLLPGFIDLVLWGHEHASIIEPERVLSKDGEEFSILQPGSTVATSLCPDEAMEKHCFILDSRYDVRDPVITPLKLESCRQVIYEDVDLDGLHVMPPCEHIRTVDMEDEQFLHNKMKQILKDAEANRNDLQPELPLVRLRVHYNGRWKDVPAIVPRKFGQAYVDKVANPSDIIMPKTYRTSERKKVSASHIKKEDERVVNVETLVKNHFKAVKGEDRLAILNVETMNKALEEYGDIETTVYTKVEKKFNEALKQQLKMYVHKINELTSESVEDTSIRDYKDFEQCVGQCIYRDLEEESEDIKPDIAMRDIKEEKENVSDSEILWD